MTKKFCSDCRKTKSTSDFTVGKNQCKPCYNQYHRLWKLERAARLSERNLAEVVQ